MKSDSRDHNKLIIRIQFLIMFLGIVPATIANCLAQEPLTTGTKKFRFGISLSPEYGFRSLINKEGTADMDAIISLRNEKEKAIFRYTVGIISDCKITNRLYVETGLQFSRKGYGFRKSDLLFGDQIDPRYGFTYNNVTGKTPKKVKFNYNYNYVEIPLRIKIRWGQNKLALVSGIGITTSYLISATQTTVFEFEDGDKERDIEKQRYDNNKLNLFAEINAGICYRLYKDLEINIEPTFKYGLLKIIDAPISARLWNGGINFSCYYSF